jgi:hypothetical protein
MSTIILFAYRIADSRIILIKNMPPVNAFEETPGFEIQLKPEQRKSIINLPRGEDAGYRDSSYGIIIDLHL